MLALETALSFFTVALLLGLAPGPDNLFVLAQSALYGARSGLAIIAGLCSGNPLSLEPFQATERGLFYGRALVVLRPDAAGEIEVRIVQVGHERREEVGKSLIADIRQNSVDVRADQLLARTAEVSSAHLVAISNDAIRIDR